MTSALTVSCLFNVEPGVLGQEWGERSTWKLDYDNLPAKNMPHKHSSWVQEPWAHSCFIIIQHPAVGSHLELVWDKIKQTTTAGHRVVSLIEDPATRALEKNTRHTLLRLHGVCRAHFPPGIILNTSRHQYNGPPGLMTAKGHFWSVDYNGCVQCPKHRTARTAGNSNTRQVSLWCFDGHSSFIEPDPNQFRELACLLQGTGGGGNNSKHSAIWYTTNKKAVSLDWRDQYSCKKLDFCLPWKIAGWQPSSLQSALLPTDVVPEEGQPDLLAAQTC